MKCESFNIEYLSWEKTTIALTTSFNSTAKLFTHLWSNLVAALTNLQVYNFSHDDSYVAERLHNQAKYKNTDMIKGWCVFMETGVSYGSTSNHFDGFDGTEKPKSSIFPILVNENIS